MFSKLKNAARWFPLLAALAVLGCSTIQFAYNNVDWVLLNKSDHYLNLTDNQKERAREVVAARMQLHRREELPIYIDTLREVRIMLTDNLSPAELEVIKQTIPEVYKRTMRDTIPGVVTLLTQIDDAQIDHLQARIEERNRDFSDAFLQKTMQARLDGRVKRSTNMVEYFIGELRPEQIEVIAYHRNAMPLTAGDWLAYHQSRQQELLAMLRRRASALELEDFLIAWWVELADQPPMLKRKMAINTDAWTEMILDLDATVDREQRQMLLDKLDHFIEEFEKLLPEQAA